MEPGHHWTYGIGAIQRGQMEVEWKEKMQGEREKVRSMDGKCSLRSCTVALWKCGIFLGDIKMENVQ